MKKGSTNTLETRRKISESLKGKPRSKESIIKQKLSWTPERRLRYHNLRTGNKASDKTKKKQSISHKIAWSNPELRKRVSEKRKGVKFTDEHIKNLTEANRKKAKDPEICKKLSLAGKGKRRSESFKQSIRGEHNNSWKGGRTPIYKLIRDCANYYQWREAVYKRDNYCDWFSGIKGNGNLNVHHIVSFKYILKHYNIKTVDQAMVCKELWDVNNGITMIESNHVAYHSMWGKDYDT